MRLRGGGYSSFVQPCIIGNDVWIAANVVITRGVKIGDGAVIGAAAVVTHDIPPYEIWAGVPARKIGQRFSNDIVQELLQLKWWNISEDRLRENLSLFTEELSLEKVKILRKKLQLN